VKSIASLCCCGAWPRTFGVPLYLWSVTEGLSRAGGTALCNSDQPEQTLANMATIQGDAVCLLKDLMRYC
jgi:hypothetical protein